MQREKKQCLASRSDSEPKGNTMSYEKWFIVELVSTKLCNATAKQKKSKIKLLLRNLTLLLFLKKISATRTVHQIKFLKALDAIGNCQRLAFTVGVSQHMHKITNM